jgi:spore photoproduct lyase
MPWENGVMDFHRLLQIRRIFAQPAALELPRGKEIVARWPEADVVPVENHWNIPELQGVSDCLCRRDVASG